MLRNLETLHSLVLTAACQAPQWWFFTKGQAASWKIKVLANTEARTWRICILHVLSLLSCVYIWTESFKYTLCITVKSHSRSSLAHQFFKKLCKWTWFDLAASPQVPPPWSLNTSVFQGVPSLSGIRSWMVCLFSAWNLLPSDFWFHRCFMHFNISWCCPPKNRN